MQNQWTKRYDGCLEPWKVRLAVARCRALGLPADRWPDALQELALASRRFRFNADKANGAKESTAFCALVNNRIISMLRREQRERERLDRYRDALGISATNADRHPHFAYEPKVRLRLDVQLAVVSLPDQERSVCALLMRGDSIRQIAAALGCTWHAVRRIIERIRERFEQLGLDGWVQA